MSISPDHRSMLSDDFTSFISRTKGRNFDFLEEKEN